MMVDPARLDPFWNPGCALGLQLCHCLDSENRKLLCELNKGNASNFDLFSTPNELIEAQQNRKLFAKMTRHNRPSLSNDWAISIVSLPSTPTLVTPETSSRLEEIRALRPIVKDHHHQDSLFGNSFQSKSFFVVHPEWLSEAVDNTDPQPLHRPPWPWEQPRYRQNIQLPITYKAEETEDEQDKSKTEDQLNGDALPMSMDVPMCLPIGYTFTQPGIDLTKPYEKQTQFGAPLVDTSVYKLGY